MFCYQHSYCLRAVLCACAKQLNTEEIIFLSRSTIQEMYKQNVVYKRSAVKTWSILYVCIISCFSYIFFICFLLKSSDRRTLLMWHPFLAECNLIPFFICQEYQHSKRIKNMRKKKENSDLLYYKTSYVLIIQVTS